MKDSMNRELLTPQKMPKCLIFRTKEFRSPNTNTDTDRSRLNKNSVQKLNSHLSILPHRHKYARGGRSRKSQKLSCFKLHSRFIPLNQTVSPRKLKPAAQATTSSSAEGKGEGEREREKEREGRCGQVPDRSSPVPRWALPFSPV